MTKVDGAMMGYDDKSQGLTMMKVVDEDEEATKEGQRCTHDDSMTERIAIPGLPTIRDPFLGEPDRKVLNVAGEDIPQERSVTGAYDDESRLASGGDEQTPATMIGGRR